MKKTFFLLFIFLLIGCAPASNSLGSQATPSPTLDYDSATQQISIAKLKDVCSKYLEPLGNPEFTAELVAVDEAQNPGTIRANIYPIFQVNGKPNTTVQFGTGAIFPNAYRTIGNKVYLLAGADRTNTANIILKQNDGIIGYLAQFEVSFDLKGQTKPIKTIGCSPIKDKDTNQ